MYATPECKLREVRLFASKYFRPRPVFIRRTKPGPISRLPIQPAFKCVHLFAAHQHLGVGRNGLEHGLQARVGVVDDVLNGRLLDQVGAIEAEKAARVEQGFELLQRVIDKETVLVEPD